MKRPETRNKNRLNNSKFLNVTLFEKREKEKLNNEQFKTMTNFYTTQYTTNISELPYLTTQTTMPSSTRTYSTIQKKKTKNYIKTRNFNTNILDKTYITETPYLITDSNRSNSTGFNTDLTYDGKNDGNNIRLLDTFEKNASSIKKTYNNTIEEKHNAIKIKKEYIKEYINKTREYKLMKFCIGLKKERTLLLKEEYENEIEKIDSIMSSVEQTKKLFNDAINIKFNDYVKELEIQTEIEKSEKANLLTEILKLKNEINQIETKIKKVEFEKNNIIRWIYFQISIKEKKYTLPSYYISLIEETEENIKKIFDNPLNFQIGNKKRLNEKMLHLRETKRKESVRGTRRGLTTFIEKLATSNKPNILGIYKNITFDEAVRIRNYKYNLCFNTPEDFMDALKKYEKETRNYISYYNELSNNIFELKTEKDLIEKEKEKAILSKLPIIKEKEFALNIQKNRYNLLFKEYANLKGIHNQKQKTLRKETRRNLMETTNIIPTKQSKLFDSILKLYNTCSKIPINEAIVPEALCIKKINSREEEMIDLLIKIEIIVSYLYSVVGSYKKENSVYYDTYKKLLNNLDRIRKIEKSKKQREEAYEKFNRLKENVEIRNNKIYFLPRRQFKSYSSYATKRKNKIKRNDFYRYRNLEFKDFMHDIDNINYNNLLTNNNNNNNTLIEK